MEYKRMSREEMYMHMAEIASRRSTCNRLQVGTIITDGEMKNILSLGWNGNYAGGPNQCDKKDSGGCMDIHSEVNALVKCPFERNRKIFITDSPCLMCAKLMINSSIEMVYYRRKYRDSSGLKLLKKAKIKTIQIK